MALHDIDKQSDDRANPKLNADDNVADRQSHETLGTTYRRAGGNTSPTLVMQQGAIQSYDSVGNRNLFFGYNPSLNKTRPVLRVAKDGYDAVTATNDQLVFNSEQNTLKVVQTGNAYINSDSMTAGSIRFAEVYHNLGYQPVPLVYVTDSSGLYVEALPRISSFGSAAGVMQFNDYCYAYADDTKLVIAYTSAVAGSFGNQKFKYYLLQETAA